jgi:hypothetical protein
LKLFLCDDIGYAKQIDTFAQEVDEQQAECSHHKREDAFRQQTVIASQHKYQHRTDKAADVPSHEL